MAEKTTIPLPIVSFEYDQQNESANRRLIEQALQDINSEIGTLKTMQQPIVSRSLKRHQFLLMGAKSV